MNINSNLKQRKQQVDFASLYHLLHAYVQMVDKEETREKQNKESSLKSMGQRLGRNIIEAISTDDTLDKLNQSKVQKDKQYVPYVDQVKYICTDFWYQLFDKKIVQVQHDSKGRFYLTEPDFTLLNKISSLEQRKKDLYVDLWKALLAGIIEGAFVAFNIESEVTCQVQNPVQIKDPNKGQQIFLDHFKTQLQITIDCANFQQELQNYSQNR